MARAFLLSHGLRIETDADTFVPAGRTISFYSEVDQGVLRVNGLAVVSNGSIPPTQTLTGPCRIPNYVHIRFDDREMAQHLAALSSDAGGRAYFVGGDEVPSSTYLCTGEAACEATYPLHAAECTGIFARVAEEDISSIACRLVRGQPAVVDRNLHGNADLADETTAEAARILEWAQHDPDGAMAYWQSLPQATQAMLSAHNGLRQHIERYFADGGAASPAAVLQAREYLASYGEATFYAWVSTMPEGGPRQALILADHDLAAAYQRGWAEATRAELLDGAPHQAGDQLAQLAGGIAHRAGELSMVLDAFTGAEHDDLAAADHLYQELMGDLEHYRDGAGDNRAAAAAATWAAGAELGNALAAHREQHDGHSLATVQEKVAVLADWAHTLH